MLQGKAMLLKAVERRLASSTTNMLKEHKT